MIDVTNAGHTIYLDGTVGSSSARGKPRAPRGTLPA